MFRLGQLVVWEWSQLQIWDPRRTFKMRQWLGSVVRMVSSRSPQLTKCVQGRSRVVRIRFGRVALAPISLFLMESRLHSSGKHVENNENEDGFEKSFKEMISTLPTTKSWRSSENLFQYQGFWLHPAYLKGVVSAQQQFQAQPTDIMLCNLPKTGTTWLKSLIFSIITRASFQDSLSPLLSKTPHEVVPFMELDHAHFPLTETSDFQCWLRMDPKDSFVSLYHLNVKIQTSQNTGAQPLDLNEAFELFCAGKILFLKYEEMVDDTVLYVNKLAEFIGHPFSVEEQQQGVPEKIVKMCSFENLSSLEVNKSGKVVRGEIQNKMYFRKGKVGDWKNHLTPEMAAWWDQITLQKLSGSNLSL
ncbi:hypothetical protein V6N13_099547 [Hibiscus sabdariffa]